MHISTALDSYLAAWTPHFLAACLLIVTWLTSSDNFITTKHSESRINMIKGWSECNMQSTAIEEKKDYIVYTILFKLE